MKKTEKYKNWSLTAGMGLFILKLEDPVEGVETIWVDKDQLEDLKKFLGGISFGEFETLPE
jgi:hypothetical protein